MYNFFRCFVLFNLIQVLYINEVTGSYAFAMGMMTLMSLFNALLDVPTVVLSDKIGRKNTLILSTISYMLTTLLYVQASYFNPKVLFIMGSFFYGLALSLYSGTLSSIAYETMVQLKIKNRYSNFVGKCSSTTQLGHAIAALLAGFLSYKIGYVYAVGLTIIPQLISLVLVLFIVEAENKRYISNNNVDLKEIFKRFRESKKLILICLTKSVTIGSKNASHRFEPVYFKLLIPIQFVGFLRFLKQFCGFFSYWFSGKIIDKVGEVKTLFVSVWLIGFFRVFGVTINNDLTPFLYSLTNLFHGSMLTSFSSLEQQEFTDSERASMASIIFLFSNLFIVIALIPSVVVLPLFNLFLTSQKKFAFSPLNR